MNDEEFVDKELTCVDCKTPFIFTAGEQRFYQGKNPPLSQPKRCQDCRVAKRRKRMEEEKQTDSY